jgi:hypothetical protein
MNRSVTCLAVTCLVLAGYGSPRPSVRSAGFGVAAVAAAPVARYKVTAWFAPRGATPATAFFDFSTNLITWQRTALTYPAAGGWLTNAAPNAPAVFCRCGFTLP